MTNELTVFTNEQFGELRTILIDSEPWFIGKEVATMLGYERTADAVAAHVDEEDKGVGDLPTPGGVQQMVIINESGLFSLVLSSKLPSAKAFKHWVTHDVLPAIRKHGMYVRDEAFKTAMQGEPGAMTDAVRACFTAIKCLRELHPGLKTGMASAIALRTLTDTTSLDLTRFMPLLPSEDNPGTMTPTVLGKYFNLTARKVNECLKALNLQTFDTDKRLWTLTDTGRQYGEEIPYTAHSGHAGYQLRWNDTVKDLISAYLEA